MASSWQVDPATYPFQCTTHPGSLSMPQDQFFPPIGQLAKKADDLPEELTTPDDDVQEDRPLEEVESLCMRCGEQVSLPSLPDRIT